MVRLFIGVLVPEDVKTPITDFQDSLTKMPMEVKLVERENLHISLTFLGETPEEQVGLISKRLDEVCKNYRKFTVKIGGVLLIPNESYIRVIALDVKSNGDVLENLRKDVVKLIGGDSYPAHLTLARVRKVTDKNFVGQNLKNTGLEKYFEVGSVYLIKSVATRRGPVYEVVHEGKLG